MLKSELLFYTADKLTYWRQHNSFNGISNVDKYAAERDWFIYVNDLVNGFKVSRRNFEEFKDFEENRFYLTLLTTVRSMLVYLMASIP